MALRCMYIWKGYGIYNTFKIKDCFNKCKEEWGGTNDQLVMILVKSCFFALYNVATLF